MTAAALPAGVVVALAALVGLLVGSFLNVVAYRVPLGLSVNHPRSFCPRCRHPVRARDNVPVASWLVLRGRCRDCGEPIAARYPLVEATTGASFAAVAALVLPRWFAPGICLLVGTGLVLALVERDRQPVPAVLALIGTALGAAGVVTAAFALRHGGVALGAAVGVAGAGLVGLALAALGRSGRADATALAASAPSLLPLGALLGTLPADAAGVGAAAGVLAGVGLGFRSRRGGDQQGVLAQAALVAALVAVVSAGALGATVTG